MRLEVSYGKGKVNNRCFLPERQKYSLPDKETTNILLIIRCSNVRQRICCQLFVAAICNNEYIIDYSLPHVWATNMGD